MRSCEAEQYTPEVSVYTRTGTSRVEAIMREAFKQVTVQINISCVKARLCFAPSLWKKERRITAC